MIDAILAQLRELHVVDLIDIALVTTFFYSALVLVQRAQARLVAMGILFLGALYIAARGLDLRLMTWLLQGFFAVADTPSSGTDTPICGIANTCEASSGLIATVFLPSRVTTAPTVPVAWPNHGLRSPEALS